MGRTSLGRDPPLLRLPYPPSSSPSAEKRRVPATLLASFRIELLRRRIGHPKDLSICQPDFDRLLGNFHQGHFAPASAVRHFRILNFPTDFLATAQFRMGRPFNRCLSVLELRPAFAGVCALARLRGIAPKSVWGGFGERSRGGARRLAHGRLLEPLRLSGLDARA